MIAARGSSSKNAPSRSMKAHAAREAFITSASQIVLPVVKIDGRPVGNGAPGPDRLGAAAGTFTATAETCDHHSTLAKKAPAQKAHDFVRQRRELGLAPKTGVPSNTHAQVHGP
jgi:hypothetical protein